MGVIVTSLLSWRDDCVKERGFVVRRASIAFITLYMVIISMFNKNPSFSVQ